MRVIPRLFFYDFTERVREKSTLVCFAFYIFLIIAEVFGFVTFKIEAGRPPCDTVWSVANTAMVAVLSCSSAGFYFLRGSIAKDISHGMAPLIALSGMSRRKYIASKFCSNMALVLCFMAMQFLATPLLQLLYGEVFSWDILYTLKIYALVVLPTVAMVSALALAFDALALLRGTLGNIAYFVFWMLSCTATFTKRLAAGDWTGIGALYWYLVLFAKSHFVALHVFTERNSAYTLSSLGKLPLTLPLGMGRALWFMGALMVVLLTSRFFPGFDSEAKQSTKKVSSTLWNLGSFNWPQGLVPQVIMGALVRAEFQMAVRSCRWWWWIAIVSLNVLSLLTPSSSTSLKLLALAWLLPIAVLAQLSVREHQARTADLLRCCSSSSGKRLASVWTAGVLVLLLCGSGVISRLVLSGFMIKAGAVVVGALFVSALALMLGYAGKSTRLFEVIYLLLLYAGPLRGDYRLDFTFSSPTSTSLRIITYFGAAAIVLFSGSLLLERWRNWAA